MHEHVESRGDCRIALHLIERRVRSEPGAH